MPHAGYACVNLKTHTAMTILDSPSASCPTGTTSIVLGAQGPKGATGPSGVVGVKSYDLGGVASVPTGGPFTSNSTEVGAGTISLTPGTYLISLNAKATPAMTSAVQVFPQFFVYNQARNAAFAGDLFNVGSGALESGGNTQIDSYFSSSQVVTIASDVTLYVYAFGYDSDRGSGSYALDDLTVTIVHVNAAASLANAASGSRDHGPGDERSAAQGREIFPLGGASCAVPSGKVLAANCRRRMARVWTRWRGRDQRGTARWETVGSPAVLRPGRWSTAGSGGPPP